MYIRKVSEVTEGLQETLQRLFPPLGVHKMPPALEELNALIKSESFALVAARYPAANGNTVAIYDRG
jgi:hypothetical protein